MQWKRSELRMLFGAEYEFDIDTEYIEKQKVLILFLISGPTSKQCNVILRCLIWDINHGSVMCQLSDKNLQNEKKEEKSLLEMK